jgi:GntR family transcriptional regulator, sialic acid-inducible nan operon repressor
LSDLSSRLADGPIRRRKLYQDIAERLERLIREGHYAAGDYLRPEREIANEFGVGRSAVREALFALQRMGLVVASSGERARVVSPSPKALVAELSGAARLLLSQPAGVEQFQDARALFETGLARLAARQATEEDIGRLEAALLENHVNIDKPAAFQESDIAFHYAIAQIPRNAIFTSLHEAVVGWLMEQRNASARIPEASAAAYRAHKRIYEAIKRHAEAEAVAAMEDHLAEVKSFYRQAMNLEPAQQEPKRSSAKRAKSKPS